MTTATLIPQQQFFDSNTKDFLAGGQVFSYAAGSTTPQPLYTDYTATTQLANPMTLNSQGTVTGGIWGAGTYKIVVKSADLSETIFQVDNINAGVGSSSSQVIGNLLLSGNTIAANSANTIILQAAGAGNYQFGGTTTQAATLQLYENTNSGSFSSLILPKTLTANRTLSLPDSNVDLTCIDSATPHILQQVRNSSVTPVALTFGIGFGTSALAWSSAAPIISQSITPVGSGVIIVDALIPIYNSNGLSNATTLGGFLTNSGNSIVTIGDVPFANGWTTIPFKYIIPNTSYTPGTPFTFYIAGVSSGATCYVSGTAGNTLGGNVEQVLTLTEWSA